MYRNLLILPLLCGLGLATGCTPTTSTQTFGNGSPQIVASPDTVSSMLAQSAERASLALETLASVERARTPAASVSPLSDVPQELRRTISVNWVGPIEPIAKTLADRAGYGFLVLGSEPSIPVVVSVDAENTRVVDVLRDVGLQLGMRGDVKVDARARMVEIFYAPNAGIGG